MLRSNKTSGHPSIVCSTIRRDHWAIGTQHTTNGCRFFKEALIRSNVSDLKISSVPVLGLKIFGGDLGVVSSVAMLVLSVWLYYAFRREQHCVARLVLRVAAIGAVGEKMGLFGCGAPKEVGTRLRGTLSAGFIALTVRVLQRAVYFSNWTQALYRGLASEVARAKARRNEVDVIWTDEIGPAAPEVREPGPVAS